MTFFVYFTIVCSKRICKNTDKTPKLAQTGGFRFYYVYPRRSQPVGW